MNNDLNGLLLQINQQILASRSHTENLEAIAAELEKIRSQSSSITALNNQVSTLPKSINIEQVVQEIKQLPEDWHQSGSVSHAVLDAIVKHIDHRKIYHSMETGAGKSTLLFSHISRDHKVFSLDAGNSLSVVLNSPLLNSGTIELIEGPSQVTLAAYTFKNKLQLAFLDGPHGFPFPDMEYYRIYPYLEENALLIIDDIQIPTIHHLYEFLLEEAMFSLIEVVENSAFFMRTGAPVFTTNEDGWWLQNYNKARFPIDLINWEDEQKLHNEIVNQHQEVTSRIEFGAGFHIDEGQFRWLTDEAHLIVGAALLSKPYKFHFQLACFSADAYPQFPFESRVFIDDKETHLMEFDADYKKVSIDLELPVSKKDVDIKIFSTQCFIPAEQGLGDTRRLAIQFSQFSAQPSTPTFSVRTRIGY